MNRASIACLLILLIFLFPSVKAQVVFETRITVKNEPVIDKSSAGSHDIKITVGDWVKIFHTLYNYFDADWVDIEVSYSVVYGENLISEVSTSGLRGYWTNKGEGNVFEFYFVAEAVGKVWITFEYNGSYWEHFPTSDPIQFSSVGSFSSLRFEIVEKGLPYIPILLVLVGVAVVSCSVVLLHKKRRGSRNCGNSCICLADRPPSFGKTWQSGE